MGSVYCRQLSQGPRWYIRFQNRLGKWTSKSAADTREEALEVLKLVEAGVNGAQLRSSVEDYLAFKERTGTKDIKSLRVPLNRLVKVYGTLPATSIRAVHIRELVSQWKGRLAPRTARNYYLITSRFFGWLVDSERLTSNPCNLRKHEIPKNIDKDPAWRQTAIFSRGEMDLILWHPGPDSVNRLFYALLFFTGVRKGEAACLKWGDLDPGFEPLQKLTIQRSYNGSPKTGVGREVPVHPTLAAELAQWRETGWQATFGRLPTAQDYVIPRKRRKDTPRSETTLLDRWRRDLASLGLRYRRLHDLRRTMISLSIADGARRDHLERVTHKGNRGGEIDVYTTLPWRTLCEAVLELKMPKKIGTMVNVSEKLVANGHISNGNLGQEVRFATVLATRPTLPTPSKGSKPSGIQTLKRKARIHPSNNRIVQADQRGWEPDDDVRLRGRAQAGKVL